jgi:methionyl-tRNA formyltransferase
MSRVIFMGTPAFAVPILRALIDTQQVVGVVSQPDRPAGRGQQLQFSPVKEAALKEGIALYQPRSLRAEDAAGPLAAWKPDVIVVAAFGQILRPHVLDLPPHGCLNVHASLLPRWRGASPIQHAILEGDEESGVTLMQMDKGLDTGPMYVKQAIPISPVETAQSLHDRLAALGALMIRNYLVPILGGELTASPQRDEDATYAPMIKKEDGRLDWTLPAERLERLVRAMTPWPGAYTYWQGRLLKVLSAANYQHQLPDGVPGQVVAPEPEQAVVITGEGGLQLIDVQLAGKNQMAISEFLRGRPDFVGTMISATEV